MSDGQWVRKPTGGPTVVFVHGVLSDGQACWTAPNGTYWPTLLQQEAGLENVGIYVFTYLSGILSRTYRVGDAVDSLRENLSLDLPKSPQSLIFVAHSLGGIVVRKFLSDRAWNFAGARKPVGTFLIASPTLGSDWANWIGVLSKWWFNHEHRAALEFVNGNTWLSDLDKNFSHLLATKQFPISGKELYEDKSIFLPGIFTKPVVEPFAAAKYFPDPFRVPGSDHFSIAKPESKEAIQHRLLVAFIEDFIKEETAVPSLPYSESALNVILSQTSERDMAFLVAGLDGALPAKHLSDKSVKYAPAGETWLAETHDEAEDRALRLRHLNLIEPRRSEYVTAPLGRQLVLMHGSSTRNRVREQD